MTRTLLALAACAAFASASFAAETAPAAPAAAAKPTKMGVVKVAGSAITVSRLGDEVAGKELTLDLGVVGKDAPKSIDVWVAEKDESKAAAAKDHVTATAGKDGHWSATIKLPAKIEAATTLWLAVTPADGKAANTSLPLKG
jgi:hypothetical protein